ncbi:MAG TPA: hypothetical protein VNW52_04635 [Burkholderiaceae bacterium]|jgi:hypothetical protein|nr:hypothetical protein [Burkholderiaceae bacterium]
MSFSNEILMAFADGELDAATRSAVEAAMRDDSALAEQVAQHQAMRKDVFKAFAAVLDEPIPDRLSASLQSASPTQEMRVPAANIATHAHATISDGKPAANDAKGWSWPQWGTMAAMLMIGIALGHLTQSDRQSDSQLALSSSANGVLTAQGVLDMALSKQLASTGEANAAVKIGISFVSTDGNYCRSFTLQREAAIMSGLACKAGTKWEVPVIAQGTTSTSEYRAAASETPAVVLDAIDHRLAGKALDAAGEQAAMQRDWRPVH